MSIRSRPIRRRLSGGARRWALALVTLALLAGLVSARAGAATPTAKPPGLPGPPPLAQLDEPAPPATGTLPVAGPAGPPATVPAKVSGPGLLSGVVLATGRLVTLQIACPSDGTASLSAAEILKTGVIATGRYACQDHRAQVALKLNADAARTLGELGSTLGRVKLGRGKATIQYSVTLEARAVPAPYWSDGGLVCNVLGPDSAFLSAPDFTVSPSAIIDVRPWVAFYTAADGWRWLGTTGLNHSSWYRWTATPTGVTQWVTTTGALNRWTWAPISLHPDSDTYAVGVFEVIYRYAKSTYTWQYSSSLSSSGTKGTYCNYR